MRALPVQNPPALREARRAYSKKIKPWEADQVLQLAEALLLLPGMRWIGYELVRFHAGAFCSLEAEQLERLGQGIDSWESVDTFARVLSGPAWLRGQIPGELSHGRARSPG